MNSLLLTSSVVKKKLHYIEVGGCNMKKKCEKGYEYFSKAL